MPAQIALLRAINVGGRNLVAMSDLRDLLGALGFANARSLLQSGNLIFEGRGQKGAALERVLEEATEKRLGVSVALDDFGTGYCSLNYLRRYPVDVLKIDQAFLVDVASDPVGAPFLGAMTQLAHLLGLSVIAEGVETVRQRDEVSAAGCESSQGFYYGKPMPAEEIAILLEAGLSRPPNLPRATTIELPAQRIRA